MIRLSAQYAIRAMVHIAGSPGMHTADTIAQQTGIPRGYLAKILQRLSQHRLLDTQRGIGGGYALTRPADSIMVFEVVRAIEPRDELSMCSACHSDTCRIVHFMRTFADACDDMLRRTTIAEFISDCSSRSTAGGHDSRD
jgi:Rrf2 family protein